MMHNTFRARFWGWIGLILMLLPSMAPAQTDYTTEFTTLLKTITTDRGVKYRTLAQHKAQFQRIRTAIEQQNPAALTTDAAKLAFWINAYNVLMLQNILDYPDTQDVLASGRSDVFFKTPKLIAGNRLSLNQIENQMLRRGAGGLPNELKPSRLDPRIHVALNCAAVSCPRLRPMAFTAQNLESMLSAAMREFVNSPAHFRVSGNVIVVSSLLQWYGTDFDATGRKAGDYLLGFMSPNRPDYATFAALFRGQDGRKLSALGGFNGKTVRYEYNWQVNRAD